MAKRSPLGPGEYRYRKGFAAGFDAALGVIGMGDKAGYPLTSIMAAATTQKETLERWRDESPPGERPPKAAWIYGPLAAPEVAKPK